MPNSSANYAKLSQKTEGAWNETPAANLTLKNFPFTKESLDYTKDTVVSDEIRSDRNVQDLIAVGYQAKGSIDIEISDYAEVFNTIMSAMLFQTPGGTLNVNQPLGVNGFTAYNSGGNTIFTGTAEATATGVLTFSGQPANNETFLINTHAYQFKTALTGAADEVLIGVDEATSIANAAAAVNATSGAGTTYGTGTIQNTDVSAVAAGTTLTVTARTAGTVGNVVMTTKTIANASWGGATLSGGADEVVPPLGRAMYLQNAFNSGTNQPCVVIQSGPGTFTVSPAVAPKTATSMAPAAVRASATYSYREMKNGTVANSLLIEKFFSDINEGIAFGGMMMDTAKIQIASKQLMKMTTTWIGGTAYQLSVGDYTVATRSTTSGNVLSAATNVSAIITGPNTAPIKTSTIDVKNNLRGQDAIGSAGFIGIGVGQFEATVTQDVYFANAALYNIMKAHGSLASVHAIVLGNFVMAIYLPNVKLSKGMPDITGKNTDVMLSMEGQAINSPTEGCSMVVSIGALS